MTNARTIMSELERVGAQDTVESAADKMSALGVDALPICDTSGNLHTMQGMITDTDIADRVVAQGRDLATTRVGEIPQTDTGTIGADDPIDDALATMSEHDIRRLPVVEGFRVIGVLDEADVQRALPAHQDPPKV